MQAAVVVLSGPWQVYRRDGTFTGARADINHMRFRRGLKTSLKEGRILIVSVKESELDRYKSMVEEILAEFGRPHFPVLYETGANHTLANAWYMLRFARTYGINHLTVVTSNWHQPRVQYVFNTMNDILAQAGAGRIHVAYRPAGFSRHPEVRYFERRTLRRLQEPKKVEIECQRLVEYQEAVRALTIAPGEFPPDPDAIKEFAFPHKDKGVIYNRLQEPGRSAHPPP